MRRKFEIRAFFRYFEENCQFEVRCLGTYVFKLMQCCVAITKGLQYIGSLILFLCQCFSIGFLHKNPSNRPF